MSLFDKTRVVGLSDKDMDDFECGICLGIFVNPLVTPCCRQTYCSQCLKQWLNDNEVCPNDRQYLEYDSLIPVPRVIVNLLNNITLKCDFHTNGCQAVLKMSELANHLKSCNFVNNCKICGFGMNCGKYSEHNCISILMEKNVRLSDENNEMRKQITELMGEKQELLEQQNGVKPIEKKRELNSNMNSDPTPVLGAIVSIDSDGQQIGSEYWQRYWRKPLQPILTNARHLEPLSVVQMPDSRTQSVNNRNSIPVTSRQRWTNQEDYHRLPN